MKKTGAILSLVLILVMLASSFCFADGLTLVSSSPLDGETGKHPQNMAVKLEFDEDMTDEANIEFNASKISIKDPEGKEIPFQLIVSKDKAPNELWVVLEEELASDTEYTASISAGIKSGNGSALAEDKVINFKTRNINTDNKLSVGMMVVMMIFMFGFTSKSMKESLAEMTGADEVKATEKNPYKIAKEKNISVEDAKKAVEKKQEKVAKKGSKKEAKEKEKAEALAARVAELEAKYLAEAEAERKANNYRVKKAASLRAAGGTVPKSVIRKNKAKRAAAKKAENAKK